MPAPGQLPGALRGTRKRGGQLGQRARVEAGVDRLPGAARVRSPGGGEQGHEYKDQCWRLPSTGSVCPREKDASGLAECQVPQSVESVRMSSGERGAGWRRPTGLGCGKCWDGRPPREVTEPEKSSTGHQRALVSGISIS